MSLDFSDKVVVATGLGDHMHYCSAPSVPELLSMIWAGPEKAVTRPLQMAL